MVRYSILRNSVIQFVILSGLTIFAMTTIYAQSGGTTGQSPPGQKGAASGQESSLPRNDDTPTGQDMPNHSGSPSVSPVHLGESFWPEASQCDRKFK